MRRGAASTDDPAASWVCVDVGSTFTKAAALDGEGRLLSSSEAATTSSTDVLVGVDAAVDALGVGRISDDTVLGCSSAGGGLRLAVVGQERVVSAAAGQRVALSAGARVLAVWSGPLDAAGVAEVVASAPDVVLLVGGTDGGDQEVLLHNARALGRSALESAVVVAGNADGAATAASLLRRRGRVVHRAGNVLPRIGHQAPDSARGVIREVFIEHVIGGKGLSSGRRFARLVRCATPDAVLAGVEVLAGVLDVPGDVLVVDVGGATTDVYSVLDPPGDDDPQAPVAGWASAARTVEGDLGVRWSAPDVVAAAVRDRLVETATAGTLTLGAEARRSDPGLLPRAAGDADTDLTLARLAATIAVRRHARPDLGGRDLRRVGLVVGSGGVLRHASGDAARDVLAGVLADRAGGWALPTDPRVVVDSAYLLAPVGLLAITGRRQEDETLAGQLMAG